MGARKPKWNILIVDDEETFLLSLRDGLSACTREFNLFTALNGKEAIAILKELPIDLVVTDLKMPVLDGFDLIAYMSRVHPVTPVLVMSAFGTPEIDERLREAGIPPCLEKPLELNTLVERILGELSGGGHGYVRGVSLPSFLQLIAMDRKTCTLSARADGRDGVLYFQDGEILDASTDEEWGIDAALDIATWEGVEMELKSECRKTRKTIKESLTCILLEAFRRRDERLDNNGIGGSAGPSIRRGTDTNTNHQPRQEESAMGSQDKLKEFATLPGFVGVGVFTPTGEALALLSSESKDGIKTVGILANNVMINAQKASLEMGTGRGQFVHIEAEKAHIFVRCLNEGTEPLKSMPGKAHIHLVLILTSDESIGLAKMKIHSLVTQLADDFRV